MEGLPAGAPSTVPGGLGEALPPVSLTVLLIVQACVVFLASSRTLRDWHGVKDYLPHLGLFIDEESEARGSLWLLHEVSQGTCCRINPFVCPCSSGFLCTGSFNT